MITCYTGRPGAGKSYSATVLAVSALLAGRPVWTNLPFIESQLLRAVQRAKRSQVRRGIWRLQKIYGYVRERGSVPCFGSDLLHLESDSFFEDPDCLRAAFEAGRRRGGAVIVVDEIGARFDKLARQPQAVVDAYRQLLAEHRHYYASLVWIAQSHHQVDALGRRVKALVGQWAEVSSLKDSVGYPGYVREVFLEHFGDHREPISRVQGRYNRAVFSLYRSHALGGSGDFSVEMGAETEITAGPSGRRKFVLAAVFVVAGVAGLAVSVWAAYPLVRDVFTGAGGFLPGEFASSDSVGDVPVLVDGTLPGVRPVAAVLADGRWVEGGRVHSDSSCRTWHDGLGRGWVLCP